MRSRIAAGMAGLVVGLSITGLVGACGSDGRAEVETSTVEVAPSWNGDLERDQVLDEAEAREDALTDGGHRPQDCRSVGAAIFFLPSYGANRPRLRDDALRAEWDALAESLMAAAPPGLRDELEVIRTTMLAYGTKMAGFGLEDLRDPERQQERDDAEALIDTPEAHEASDTIEAYLLSCPAL